MGKNIQLFQVNDSFHIFYAGVDQSLFDATLRETENRFTTEINQLRLQLLEKEGENQTLKAEVSYTLTSICFIQFN